MFAGSSFAILKIWQRNLSGSEVTLDSRGLVPVLIQIRRPENVGRSGKSEKKVIESLISENIWQGWNVPFEFSPELPGFPYKW